MAKQVKSTAKVTNSEMETITPTPVPKVSRAKKVKSVEEVTVSAVDTVVSTENVVGTDPVSIIEDLVSDGESPLMDVTIHFFTKLQEATALLSSLKSEFRVIEKKWTRELKAAQKITSKKKRKSGNRAPSGFVKPTKISDELASFLGKDLGSEMARTQVTREINTYIRANNLQDKTNGRKINPDTKLAVLLKIQDGDDLTYFNLQRYMSPHFFKNVKVEPTNQIVNAEV